MTPGLSMVRYVKVYTSKVRFNLTEAVLYLGESVQRTLEDTLPRCHERPNMYSGRRVPLKSHPA